MVLTCFTLLLIIIVCFIIYLIWTNHSLAVTTYEMEFQKLPELFDGCRIALIADLHSNSYGLHNKKLIETIEQQKPDFVVVAGDLIVGQDDFNSEIALNLMKKLCEKYPVYYSLGNHEQKLSIYEQTKKSTYVEYLEKLKKLGIHYLDNQKATISRNKQEICITGLSIGREYYAKVWNQKEMPLHYVQELVGDAEDTCFNILLAHNPQYLKQYAAWGADLVLAGHVHGGIMRLPIFGGVISPSLRLFPKYDFGEFVEGKTKMILSRGIGTHTIKIRIFNTPELVLVRLKR